MNEKSVTLELVTDPVANERARAYDRRLKRNLDWLNARWDDLLPGDGRIRGGRRSGSVPRRHLPGGRRPGQSRAPRR